MFTALFSDRLSKQTYAEVDYGEGVPPRHVTHGPRGNAEFIFVHYAAYERAANRSDEELDRLADEVERQLPSINYAERRVRVVS